MSKTALVLCLAWAATCWSDSSWQADHVIKYPISQALFKPLGAIGLNSFYKSQQPKHQGHDQIPPYYEIKKLVEEMEQLVLSYTTFDRKPPIKDPRRHYLALLGVIYHIVDVISDTCHPDAEVYEEDYMILVEEYMSTALNNPNEAASRINGLISDAQKKTEGIRGVILHLCGDNTDDPYKCDTSVTAVLEWAPRDQKKQAKLLLKLGDLAQLFKEFSTEFEDVAANHQEMVYLLDLTVKARLKPLVLSAVEIILALDNNQPCNNQLKDLPILPVSYNAGKHLKRHNSVSPLNKVRIIKVVPAVWGGLLK